MVMLRTIRAGAAGFAVVNVEGTRVIFNAGEMVSSVNLINSGGALLVQLWFDEGIYLYLQKTPEHRLLPSPGVSIAAG